MKQVIDGKTYDTEESELLRKAEIQSFLVDTLQILYLTKDDECFLLTTSEYQPDPRARIKPVTHEEAGNLLDCCIDTFELRKYWEA